MKVERWRTSERSTRATSLYSRPALTENALKTGRGNKNRADESKVEQLFFV